MWEFRNRERLRRDGVLDLWRLLDRVWAEAAFRGPTAHAPLQLNRDLGWIVLAFLIFNTYMLIISTR